MLWGMYVDIPREVVGMDELEKSKIYELESGYDAQEEKIKELQYAMSVANVAIMNLQKRISVLEISKLLGEECEGRKVESDGKI